MRMIRALTAAVAVVAALPSAGAAQQGRSFKDAWFWGIKAGGYTYADAAGAFKQAPVGGLDWVITRTHGGLYISLDQAFLKTQTIFAANPAAPDTLSRFIDIKNVRKMDFALLGFPGTHIVNHPYIGLGFRMTQAASAAGQGPFADQEAFDATEALILETKVSFSPVVMAGLQRRMRRMSVFGQLSVSPTQKNFILYNGRQVNLSYEIGARYNIGSSISRDY